MNDNQKFEKIIKVTKRKNTLKNVLISIGTTILAGTAIILMIYVLIGKQMNVKANEQIKAFNIADLIYSPNITSTTQYYSFNGRTHSTLTSNREKNIDGYHVAYPDRNVSFSLNGVESTSSGFDSPNVHIQNNGKNIMATNSKTQQKEPIFFNVGYEKWYNKQKNKRKLMSVAQATHEASTLSTLKNTLGEVAITFNKRYTYHEILDMLPKNVMLNYYWLGFHTNKLDTASGIGQYVGINADDDGSGKLIDQFSGKLDKNQYVGYQGLKKALKAEVGQSVVNDVDIAKDAQKQLSLNLKTAKFAGVIVTGKTENLAKLDQLSYVYATNVGVTTAIMPYQTPIK